MSWVDLAIIVILVVATLGGMAQGFLRSICSLGGLVLGLALAAWNYDRVAALLKPVIPVRSIDNVIGFLVIALLVMALANLVGGILARTVKSIGLGCLDKLGGAVVGFVQGALLVMLCILVTVAFFPGQRWLAEARLPQMFFGACHVSTQISPGDLGNKVRDGLRSLQNSSPQWMHPGNGTS